MTSKPEAQENLGATANRFAIVDDQHTLGDLRSFRELGGFGGGTVQRCTTRVNEKGYLLRGLCVTIYRSWQDAGRCTSRSNPKHSSQKTLGYLIVSIDFKRKKWHCAANGGATGEVSVARAQRQTLPANPKNIIN